MTKPKHPRTGPPRARSGPGRATLTVRGIQQSVIADFQATCKENGWGYAELIEVLMQHAITHEADFILPMLIAREKRERGIVWERLKALE